MVASRFVLHLAAALGMCAALPILWSGLTPVTGHLDVSGHAVGRDFVNLWVGGRLLWEGQWQTLFNVDAYQDALHRLFDPQLRKHLWSYPPTSFLLAAPLALMPYGVALEVWTLAGLAAVLAVARMDLGPSAARRVAVLLLLAPATLLNVLFGQNGFLTAALMAGGVLLLDRRPVLAGVLIGLLSYKPHFGIVIAPALVALGAWRTIATAAATALAMVLVSVALFGVAPWLAFLQETVPYHGFVLKRFVGFFTTMLTSPYATLRGLDLDHAIAWPIQGLITVAAVLACAIAVRRTNDADTRLALIGAATFLATPYALTYDLTVVALVIARLCAREPETRWNMGEAVVYGGTWALPLASLLLALMGLQLAPALMIALFLMYSKPLMAIGWTSPAISAPSHHPPSTSGL
jgi:hypothetical protein